MNPKSSLRIAATAVLLASQLHVAAQAANIPQSRYGYTSVTLANMPSFLEAAGYNPVRVNDRQYKIAENVLGGRLYLHIFLSESGRKLWIQAICTETRNTQEIPRHVLVKLLQENQQRGPFHFALGADTNNPNRMLLWGNLPVDNHDMGVDAFQRQVRFFIEQLEATQKTWHPNNW